MSYKRDLLFTIVIFVKVFSVFSPDTSLLKFVLCLLEHVTEDNTILECEYLPLL